MVQPAARHVTLEEFLVAEANDPSGVRREWIDGQVYAMSGATPEHGRLCTAVLAELRAALRGKCTVRDGSVAIHIPTTKAGLRPDASVVCGAVMKTVVEKIEAGSFATIEQSRRWKNTSSSLNPPQD